MTKPRITPMTPGIPRAGRIRAYLAGAVVTLGLPGVAYKAWGLQIGEGERYRVLADKQHTADNDQRHQHRFNHDHTF